MRVVLDTNVVLAANRTTHPSSPNAEILARWKRGEFTCLHTLDTLSEYAEKLLEHGVSASKAEEFLRLLARLGESVAVVFFHFRHYLAFARRLTDDQLLLVDRRADGAAPADLR